MRRQGCLLQGSGPPLRALKHLRNIWLTGCQARSSGIFARSTF